MGKIWTKKDVEFLTENYHTLTAKELSFEMNRTENAIYFKAVSLNLNKKRRWTQEDDEVLLNLYGKYSIQSLCKTLNRSEKAIKERLFATEGVSGYGNISGNLKTSDIALYMGVHISTVQKLIKEKEIKAARPKRVYYVIESSFWKWLKNNLNKCNFDKITDDVEMIVPEWYRQEIKKHKSDPNKVKARFQPWLSHEEATLWNCYIKGLDIEVSAKRIQRSVISARNKLCAMKKLKLNK